VNEVTNVRAREGLSREEVLLLIVQVHRAEESLVVALQQLGGTVTKVGVNVNHCHPPQPPPEPGVYQAGYYVVDQAESVGRVR
jgi:hypothetical protein